MTRRFEGKVVLVTGAARGQGKSHSVRFAEEGATVIAVDILEQIETVRYAMGSEDDLADTVAQVTAVGGTIRATKADVRVRDQLEAVVAGALEEFGRLDVVVANAGILPLKTPTSVQSFIDALDVDLIGVLNTVAVTVPHLTEGSAIVITGSTAGLMPGSVDNPALGPGGVGYGMAKRFLVGYTETLAMQLAPSSVRVNAIHPTNVNTNLLHNDDLYRVFRPDVAQPTVDDVRVSFTAYHALPVPYVEPRDVSEAVLWLASDDARTVTGVNLRIDAGSLLKSGSLSQQAR
ncbi:MAG: mycofactocin-coupled SDR family oxidoreductase [Nocardioides sp.]|uniref:mycofactocin-coupled SDR family oxidoreductase n=1 Tax=Nocardioides sp. TaxID=35761 RepID=UPI0039E6BF94